MDAARTADEDDELLIRSAMVNHPPFRVHWRIDAADGSVVVSGDTNAARPADRARAWLPRADPRGGASRGYRDVRVRLQRRQHRQPPARGPHDDRRSGCGRHRRAGNVAGAVAPSLHTGVTDRQWLAEIGDATTARSSSARSCRSSSSASGRSGCRRTRTSGHRRLRTAQRAERCRTARAAHTTSRSTGCPVIDAISSKSLSTCSTVRPPSSATAAIIKSGIDGARC